MRKCLLDGCLVKKRNFLCEIDIDRFAFMVFFLFKEISKLHITPKDKEDAYGQADAHTFQEVRQYHGNNCNDERDELVLARTPHMLKHFGTGQFEPYHDQDGCKTCHWYFI